MHPGMRNPDKTTDCPRLTRHFTYDAAKHTSFIVQVVEKISGNGQKKDGMEDETITQLRMHREHFWIKESRPVHPCGLN